MNHEGHEGSRREKSRRLQITQDQVAKKKRDRKCLIHRFVGSAAVVTHFRFPSCDFVVFVVTIFLVRMTAQSFGEL
jgi:hypothetical protein